MRKQMILMVGLMVFGGHSAVTLAQSTRTYRAEAQDVANVRLDLCSSVVQVTVRGDRDTDLDFVITDNRGNVVHRDVDGTDFTSAVLRPDVSSGCVPYQLQVANLGSVYNCFSVTLQNRDASVAAASGDGRNRRIAVHNHTAETITALRWSNTARDQWGVDQLGASVMRRSSNRTFNIDDGTGSCRYDFRAETQSGQVYTQRNVNVCAVSTVEFGTEVSH